jgi:hypothetical protein
MAVRRRPPTAVAILVALATILGARPASGAGAASAVVARDGLADLRATQERGALCLTVKIEDEDEGAGECAEAGEAGHVVHAADDAGRAYIGAAISAAAVAVEVRRAGKLLADAPTVAGEAYGGVRAGEVRFALVRLPDRSRLDGLRVRALDGSGVVLETVAGSDGDLVSDRRPLLSGRSGGARWRVTSERASALRSSVVDPDHELVVRCVRTTVVYGPSTRSYRTCTGEAPVVNLQLLFSQGRVEDHCRPAFRLVYGVLDEPVRDVSVLRGDGRRVAARMARVPGTALTAYALAVPARAAVRGVRIRPEHGPARTLDLDGPPIAVSCGLGLVSDERIEFGAVSEIDDAPHVTPLGPVAAVPGSPALRIADGPDATLCMALGDDPFTGLACDVIGPSLAEPFEILDDFDRPRALALALPARVATVRLTSRDGKSRDVPTVAADGYAGLYAGRVRFAVTAIAGHAGRERVALLDAAGRTLHVETSDSSLLDIRVRDLPARRVAGRPGRPSVWQSGFVFKGRTTRCVSLTAGPAPPADERCSVARGASPAILLDASCATHRLTVAVAAGAGTRAIARTSDGRDRRIALRRGVGVLTLARSLGVRSLSIVSPGAKPRTVALHAPAGGAQCGWDAAGEMPSPA